jgi:hypothetical protein
MGLLRKALARAGSNITENENAGVLDQIARYHRTNPLFYGIVFETLPTKKTITEASRVKGRGADVSVNQNNTLFEDISALIGKLGRVIELPSRRVLALFPHSLDRAVITQCISKSLSTGVVDDFEADSPGAAFERIQDYL